MPNGERQITAYLLPGDLSNRHHKAVKEMDHSIGALSPCRVASIRGDRLADLAGEHENIATALQVCAVVDEAISREWLVSLGRRSAPQRIAHLICEMFARLQAIGLTEGNSFEMPLTQVQLADMMGLSVVHMNRSLSRLRGEGLIEYSGGRMTVKNHEGLIRRAGFDPFYLRQSGEDESLLRAV